MAGNITLGTDPAASEIKKYFRTDFRKTYSKKAGIYPSETLSYSEDVEDWNINLLTAKAEMAQGYGQMHQQSPTLLHTGLILSSEYYSQQHSQKLVFAKQSVLSGLLFSSSSLNIRTKNVSNCSLRTDQESSVKQYFLLLWETEKL